MEDIEKELYQVWKGVKQRVGSRGTSYQYVKLHEDWEDFNCFYEWAVLQDGHDTRDSLGCRYQLDKDILNFSSINKIYSPDTCCFVPQEINKQFRKEKSGKGHPTGVSGIVFNSDFYMYEVTCLRFQKSKDRFFDNFQDAFTVWKDEKRSKLQSLACKYKDTISPKVYGILYNFNPDFKPSNTRKPDLLTEFDYYYDYEEVKCWQPDDSIFFFSDEKPKGSIPRWMLDVLL